MLCFSSLDSGFFRLVLKELPWSVKSTFRWIGGPVNALRCITLHSACVAPILPSPSLLLPYTNFKLGCKLGSYSSMIILRKSISYSSL